MSGALPIIQIKGRMRYAPTMVAGGGDIFVGAYGIRPISILLRPMLNATLFEGFEKDDACGDRDVEGLNFACHGYFEGLVGGFEQDVGDAVFFGAHDDSCGDAHVAVVVSLLGFFGAGNNLESAGFEIFNSFNHADASAHRNFMESACGCFDGIGTDAHGIIIGDDNGIGTRTFGRAGNGAEIAYVGDAVEDENEGRFSFFKNKRNDVFDIGIGDVGDKTNDTLMVFGGDAIEFLDGNKLISDIALGKQIAELVKEFGFQSVLN